jgi:hypothetical protein
VLAFKRCVKIRDNLEPVNKRRGKGVGNERVRRQETEYVGGEGKMESEGKKD